MTSDDKSVNRKPATEFIAAAAALMIAFFLGSSYEVYRDGPLALHRLAAAECQIGAVRQQQVRIAEELQEHKKRVADVIELVVDKLDALFGETRALFALTRCLENNFFSPRCFDEVKAGAICTGDTSPAGFALPQSEGFARRIVISDIKEFDDIFLLATRNQRETLVYVKPGDPTVIRFPLDIKIGFKRLLAPLTLERRGRDLIVFAQPELAGQGEALLMQLVDNSFLPLRILPANQNHPRDAILSLEPLNNSNKRISEPP